MDLAHTFRALRHRNYRLFFVGQSISLTGTWLQQVAMSWLAYRLTDSAVFLGVVAFCANISVLLFGTFAGVIADRVSRRNALLVTQGAMLVQAAVLAALVATGRIEIWHLIALSLWLGTVSAFDQPLRQSMYVELIPDRDDLGNAIALNSLMVNGARVIGPALAGALLAFASEALCFALNALSFVAVLIAIARIRWQPREHHAAAANWWSSWLEGARYAAGYAPLRNTLLMVAALAWTLQPYSTLMPVFAKYAYAGGGAQTLGWLLSAAGFGALCAALYLARRKTIVGLGTAIVLAAMAAGAALAAFSHLHYLPAGLVLMLFVGGGTTLAAAGTNVLLQTIVEDRLRGRVAGFYTIALGGVTPLGALAAGLLAGSIGAPATFLVNGALAALVALWFWRRLPGLRLQVRDRLVDLGVLDEA